MSKAIGLAVCIIVLISGVLIDRGSTVLRAGRDEIMTQKKNDERPWKMLPVYEKISKLHNIIGGYRHAKPWKYDQGIVEIDYFVNE